MSDRRTQSLVREDNFDVMFHDAPDPMAIHDEQGRLIEVNAAALKHHGYSREELLALGPGEAEAPEFRKEIPERAQRLRETGSVVFETAHVNKSGEWIPVEVHSRLITYRGRPAVLSVARDIRRRKAAEEALRQSIERFELVVRAAHDAIWDWNLRSGEIYASPQYYELLGFTPGEYIPTWEFFESLIHPDDVAAVRTARESQLREGAPSVVRYRIRTKQGEYRWHETRALTLKDENGVPVRMAGSCRDVTDQKLLEEKLAQVQRLDSIGRLAGGIAHDFNNLLTVISGYSELLARQLPEDDPRRAIALEIRSAGERGAALTRQLLAFSRRQVMQPEALDVNAAIRGMEAMLRRLVGENIRIRTRLAPRLWRVLADAGQLNQVLMNLVVNARDAMPHGGSIVLETSNVTVAAGDPSVPPNAAPGEYVVLAVRDTGLGMDEETRKHVFEPFFTTKQPGSGTGLGLATVYGIVVQSAGFVSFDSEPSKGTVFRVYLPRATQPGRKSRTFPASREISGRGKTILLAEDEADVAALVERSLAEQGYRVLKGATGEEALRAAESHAGPIDLLLADVVMPEMSGPQLAERLRLSRPGMRVLFMSGYPDSALLLHGVLHVKEHFLAKPFTPGQLARSVAAALSCQDSQS